MASAHDFTFTGIDHKPIDLRQYKGRPILVVNVASFCGFTPQYKDLQKLHETYGPKGLVVLGVPSNDFGAQEPGSNQEIAEFCRLTYGVEFPMFEKTSVTTLRANPLYADLLAQTGQAPKWNFHKYLIDRNGKVVASYGSRTKPDDPVLVARLEALLAMPAPEARR